MGLAGSGDVYIGVNLEFPGCPLSQSVHGEQFLMANLLLHRERSLHTLAISAAPCGHCRQFYSELVCAVSGGRLAGGSWWPATGGWQLAAVCPATLQSALATQKYGYWMHANSPTIHMCSIMDTPGLCAVPIRLPRLAEAGALQP